MCQLAQVRRTGFLSVVAEEMKMRFLIQQKLPHIHMDNHRLIILSRHILHFSTLSGEPHTSCTLRNFTEWPAWQKSAFPANLL